MIVVGKVNGTNQRLVSSGTKNWLLGWWSGNKDRTFTEGWVHEGNSANITNSYIYTVSGSGSGLVGGGTSFWSNGSLLTTAATDGKQAPGIISLGGWGLNNSERSTGDIAEVIYYNKVLTADERMALEKYLSDKYSISISHSGVNPKFSWTPGGATTEDLSGLDNGSYTVTVQDAAGCSKQESFVINTDNTESTAALTATASTTYICNGDAVNLSLSGGSLGTGASWEWYSGAGFGTHVGSGTNITVHPNTNTTYKVRAEGTCNTTGVVSTVEVIVNGGVGAPVAAVLPTAVGTYTATCIVNDAFTHYFYDANGYLLGAVNSNGENLGDVTVTIEVGNYGPYGQGFPPGYCGSPGVSDGEYALARNWDIQVTGVNPPSNASAITFYYLSSEVVDLSDTIAGLAYASNYISCWGNVSSEADLMMTVHHTGGTKELFPSLTPSPGPGAGMRQIAFNLSEFSQGFLHSKGGISGANNALPVELLDWEANAIDNEYIALTWRTATEINNSGFEIQRSLDGVSFESIAWVEGYGNSTQVRNYSYLDREVNKGSRYYYQLKQIDNDGASETFGIVSAELTGKYASLIGELIPNPSKENGFVHVSVSSLTAETLYISIFDHVGGKVASYQEQVAIGPNKLQIKIDALASGTYIINFEGSFGRETRKLVVIR